MVLCVYTLTDEQTESLIRALVVGGKLLWGPTTNTDFLLATLCVFTSCSMCSHVLPLLFLYIAYTNVMHLCVQFGVAGRYTV